MNDSRFTSEDTRSPCDGRQEAIAEAAAVATPDERIGERSAAVSGRHAILRE